MFKTAPENLPTQQHIDLLPFAKIYTYRHIFKYYGITVMCFAM